MKKITYSEKLKAIRPYVSLDYKRPERVSKAHKAEISAYFKEVMALKSVHHNFVKVKSETHRNEAIERFGRFLKKKDKFKGVFVPPQYGDKPKLKFRKGEAFTISTGYSEEGVYAFDIQALMDNPQEEVKRGYRSLRKYKRIIPFSETSNGEYDLNSYAAGDLASLIEEILALIQKYEVSIFKWIKGLRGINLTNQTTPEEEANATANRSKIRGHRRRKVSGKGLSRGKRRKRA